MDHHEAFPEIMQAFDSVVGSMRQGFEKIVTAGGVLLTQIEDLEYKEVILHHIQILTALLLKESPTLREVYERKKRDAEMENYEPPDPDDLERWAEYIEELR